MGHGGVYQEDGYGEEQALRYVLTPYGYGILRVEPGSDVDGTSSEAV